MAALAASYAVGFLKRTTDELAELSRWLTSAKANAIRPAEFVHKLMEERELEREKMQFQAKLAEYEKYARSLNFRWEQPMRLTTLCSGFCLIWN